MINGPDWLKKVHIYPSGKETHKKLHYFCDKYIIELVIGDAYGNVNIYNQVCGQENLQCDVNSLSTLLSLKSLKYKIFWFVIRKRERL